MNIRQAQALKPGNRVHYTGLHDCGQPHPTSKSRTVTRCRVSGSPVLWKRSPDRVRVPVKYGLYENSYITEDNLVDWHLEDDCPLFAEAESTTEPEDEDQSLVPGLEDEPPIPFPLPENYDEPEKNSQGNYLVRANDWPYIREATEEETIAIEAQRASDV